MPKPSVLKSKIELLHRELDHYLDDLAASIKHKDGENIPFETIRGMICRNQCRCAAVQRLTEEN
jgi:hypothetical protein